MNQQLIHKLSVASHCSQSKKYYYLILTSAMNQSQQAQDNRTAISKNKRINKKWLAIQDITLFQRYDTYCFTYIILLCSSLLLLNHFLGLKLNKIKKYVRYSFLAIVLFPMVGCLMANSKMTARRVWSILHQKIIVLPITLVLIQTNYFKQSQIKSIGFIFFALINIYCQYVSPIFIHEGKPQLFKRMVKIVMINIILLSSCIINNQFPKGRIPTEYILTNSQIYAVLSIIAKMLQQQLMMLTNPILSNPLYRRMLLLDYFTCLYQVYCFFFFCKGSNLKTIMTLLLIIAILNLFFQIKWKQTIYFLKFIEIQQQFLFRVYQNSIYIKSTNFHTSEDYTFKYWLAFNNLVSKHQSEELCNLCTLQQAELICATCGKISICQKCYLKMEKKESQVRFKCPVCKKYFDPTKLDLNRLQISEDGQKLSVFIEHIYSKNYF